MFKKGLLLSVIFLLIFSISGFAIDYTFTQQSGVGYLVNSSDKSDALEDTNESRTIINDLGALLFHSKMDGSYPKDLTTGGTIQIPEAGLKFGNDPVDDDIAAYIAGEMAWQTKAELGLDLSLYYLKTEIDTLGEVETIYSADITDSTELATALTDYYLKTAIDSQGEVETIWGVTLATDSELNTALADYYLKTAIDTLGELETIYTKDIIDSDELAALKFTDLADTPANYTDQAGKYVKVNAEETDLEFGTGGAGAGTYLELTDTPAAYDNGKYAKSTADGVVWDTPAGAGTVTTSGTPEANDIARFTDADTIEGVNYTELKTALALDSDDLSDVASIAMLDENETVTGFWDFTQVITITRLEDNAVGAPYWNFLRARDGDPTDDVSSGDYIGKFSFKAYHTDDYYLGATIRAIVDGAPGTENIPGRLEFLTTPDGEYNTPELRMAIDNAGNIKMGDGEWNDYINTTATGVMTAEGAATITATNLVPTVEIDAGAHSIGFTLQTANGDGATLIDWTLGNKMKFTFGAQNETITFTDPSNPCNLIMVIVQDDPGSRTITWSGMTIKWAGGTAPTLTTTADGEDIVSLFWDGTSYYGVASLAFATP